jgi:protein-arginine kinase activator protein McsA
MTEVELIPISLLIKPGVFRIIDENTAEELPLYSALFNIPIPKVKVENEFRLEIANDTDDSAVAAVAEVDDLKENLHCKYCQRTFKSFANARKHEKFGVCTARDSLRSISDTVNGIQVPSTIVVDGKQIGIKKTYKKKNKAPIPISLAQEELPSIPDVKIDIESAATAESFAEAAEAATRKVAYDSIFNSFFQ